LYLKTKRLRPPQGEEMLKSHLVGKTPLRKEVHGATKSSTALGRAQRCFSFILRAQKGYMDRVGKHVSQLSPQKNAGPFVFMWWEKKVTCDRGFNGEKKNAPGPLLRIMKKPCLGEDHPALVTTLWSKLEIKGWGGGRVLGTAPAWGWVFQVKKSQKDTTV